MGITLLGFAGADAIASTQIALTPYSVPMMLLANCIILAFAMSWSGPYTNGIKQDIKNFNGQLLSVAPLIAGAVSIPFLAGGFVSRHLATETINNIGNIGAFASSFGTGLPAHIMIPAAVGATILKRRAERHSGIPSITAAEEPKQRETLDIAVVGNPLRRIDDNNSIGYSGTERVNSTLIKHLRREGHGVVVFAPGNSHVPAYLIPTVPLELWREPEYKAATQKSKDEIYNLGVKQTLDTVYDYVSKHKETVVLFSMDDALLDRRFDGLKAVSALHGDTATQHAQWMFSSPEVQKRPVIFISRAQHNLLPGANCIGIVYNSTELDGVEPSYRQGDYLVQVSRLSPEKAPHMSMLAAEAVGMPIKIIGPDPKTPDSAAYKTAIFQPLLERLQKDGLAENLGMLSTAERDRIIRGAAAGFIPSGMFLDNQIMPRRYNEGFGLTSIEYQKHGTPSINSAFGACPETVVNGITGFVTKNQEEMIRATKLVLSGYIDRHAPPLFVRDRFSPETMTQGYLQAFRMVDAMAEQSAPERRRGSASPKAAQITIKAVESIAFP